GDERDLAERDHPAVADEDADRHDDRHRHQRRAEVDLRRRGGERAEHADHDQQEHRPGDRDGHLAAAPPRRAAEPAPGFANRPSGRTSSTRMTSANSADGRYTRLSEGSSSPRIPVATPIAKAPSVAVPSRSMPPTTTPTSTMIVSCSAKVGVTSGCETV